MIQGLAEQFETLKQQRAAEVIRGLESNSLVPLDPVIRAIEDGDEGVSLISVQLVAERAAETTAAAEALIEALECDHYASREAASDGLRRLGDAALPLIRARLRALPPPPPLIVDALRGAGTSGRAVVIDTMRHTDAELRLRAYLVAVITDQKVVSAILRHLETHDQPTSVHARDPPAA